MKAFVVMVNTVLICWSLLLQCENPVDDGIVTIENINLEEFRKRRQLSAATR